MQLKTFLLGTALAGLLAGAAEAQVSVKIGVMNDRSGLYADISGEGSVVAARMAAEDFKAKDKGINVEIISADHQNKPDVGSNIARQWYDTDGVDVITDVPTSSVALAINQITKEKNKVFLNSGAASSDLTGKACSPMAFQFLVDTYSLPKAGVQTLIDKGIKTFFFVTVDYAFGAALQTEATRFIEQAGGKVVGSVKHPLGTTDFSSYLLQAQSSGAKAIVILNAGLDLSNSLKQAAEFRITKGGQSVSVFGMTINSVAAMGLETAQGLNITVPFYWDRDDASRAWSKRFMERNNAVVPTYIMAGVYSAVTHYLKSVQAAGTDAGPAVVAKMKATPVNDFMSKDVKIREDGQVMRPVYPVEVKSPAQSKGKNDFYTVGAAIPAEKVFRPLSEGGCDFVKK